MRAEVFQESDGQHRGLIHRVVDFVTRKKIHEHDIGWRWVLFGSEELAFLLPRGLTLYTTSARTPRTETKQQLYREIRKSRGMSFRGQGVNVYMPKQSGGDVNMTIEAPDAVLPKLLNIWLQWHQDAVVIQSADPNGNLSLWEGGKERAVHRVRLDARWRGVRFHPAFAVSEQAHRNPADEQDERSATSQRRSRTRRIGAEAEAGRTISFGQ